MSEQRYQEQPQPPHMTEKEWVCVCIFSVILSAAVLYLVR